MKFVAVHDPITDDRSPGVTFEAREVSDAPTDGGS